MQSAEAGLHSAEGIGRSERKKKEGEKYKYDCVQTNNYTVSMRSGKLSVHQFCSVLRLKFHLHENLFYIKLTQSDMGGALMVWYTLTTLTLTHLLCMISSSIVANQNVSRDLRPSQATRERLNWSSWRIREHHPHYVLSPSTRVRSV